MYSLFYSKSLFVLSFLYIQGHIIDAVGWNKANTSETTTGEILMGTTRGWL